MGTEALERHWPWTVEDWYALDGDEYRLTHRVGAGIRAIITEPFPVEFDPAVMVES